METMVERVAKAIDKVLGDDHESLSIEMGCGSIAAKLRTAAMAEAARAAIEAMREPPPNPDDPSRLPWDMNCCADYGEYGQAVVTRSGWGSLIDALLKEHSHSPPTPA
jgi:hypothetical protein